MKITFLGTGTSQGVPVIACTCPVCRSEDPRDKRLRSSILVEDQGKVIIFDTGPDFRHQMLRSGVSRVDAVVFTHEHRDHIAGLDDIRAYNYIQQKPMDIYGEERVLRALHHTFPYIFAERKYPGIPKINFHTIGNENFQIDGMNIIPVRALHYRLPVLGFRVGDFAYLTDANYISDEEIEKIRGVKVFAVCALRFKEHISHFNLEQALEVIDAVNPDKAYLTHLSHVMGPFDELQAKMPAKVHLSYDTLSMEI